MARPSKLTEAQWLEVERRHLAGAPVRQLARDFGISPARISERVSKRVTKQKVLANQLAGAEIELLALPVSEQVAVRALADELKAISVNLASAARLSSMTARQLAEVAHVQARKISADEDPAGNSAALKATIALTAAANEAAKIGMGLLAANKDAMGRDAGAVPSGAPELSHLSDDELRHLAGEGDDDGG